MVSTGVSGQRCPQLPSGPLPPLIDERIETEHMATYRMRPAGASGEIRITYRPRWKAVGGERIWLAAPSFMLVFPKTDRLELVYGAGLPVTLGRVFTAIGWSVVLLSLLPAGRRLGIRLAAAARHLGDAGPLRPVVGLVRRSGGWRIGTRYALLGAGLATVLSAYLVTAVTLQGTDADSLYRRGQTFYGAGKLDEGLPLFLEAQRLSPLSATAIHAAYFSSITMFRKEDWPGARPASSDCSIASRKRRRRPSRPTISGCAGPVWGRRRRRQPPGVSCRSGFPIRRGRSMPGIGWAS